MKKLLLFFVAFAAVLGMQAKVILTWDGPEAWTGLKTAQISYSQDGYTIAVDKKGGQTNPTVITPAETNKMAKDLRVYAQGVLTLSGGKMLKVVFNVSEQGLKRLATITPSAGTVEVADDHTTVTWTGDATSVDFTVGDKATYGSEGASKAGQLCVNSIEVYSESGDIQKEVKKPTFGGNFTFEESTQATLTAEEGCKIYWSYDEGDFEALEDCNEYTAPITLTKTTTLYAQAVDAEGTKSAIAKQTYTKQESMTVAQAMAAAAGTNVTLQATVFALGTKGAIIGDATGYMYYYTNAAPAVAIGDQITISGPLGAYNGFNQFTKDAKVEKTGTTTVAYPTLAVLDGAGVEAWVKAPAVQYVEIQGELIVSGSYYNVKINGTTTQGSVVAPTAEVLGSLTPGTTVKVRGFAIYPSANSAGLNFINMVATSMEAVGDVKPLEKVAPLALDKFTNGGFEAWTDKKPDQWTPHTTAGNATLEQSTDAHGGQYSVLVKGTSDNKRVATEELLLPAGWYTLTVWAKSENATAQARPGFVRATLNEAETSYILDSNHYAYFAYTDITSSAWTKIANTFQLEEETILSVVVMNPKNNGNILIDDVELRAATEDEVIATGIAYSVNHNDNTNQYFDLTGRRANAAAKGLLIMGGKKVLK